MKRKIILVSVLNILDIQRKILSLNFINNVIYFKLFN